MAARGVQVVQVEERGMQCVSMCLVSLFSAPCGVTNSNVVSLCCTPTKAALQ